MLYEISNQPTEINFAPETEIAEIIQNVRMIISTVKNSVPLFREFGFNGASLDLPIQLVQAQITAEIARQINLYEPRCQLKKIKCTANLNGELNILAQIEVV